MARRIGILYKCRKLLKEETLVTLYYSFVYPYFTYCLLVWGNTFSTYLDGLMKLQKRAIRTICGESKFAHTAPLFKKMNMFNFDELFIYSLGIFMFKFHSSLLPKIFITFFTYNRNIHSHYTR